MELRQLETTTGKALNSRQTKDALTKSAVDEIVNYGNCRYSWLVFASGVGHANHVCAEIQSRGITCAVVTGETPADERDRILNDFKFRRIRCLVNVEIPWLQDLTLRTRI